MDIGTSRSNSKHGEATPPPGITKVNDAVWKFHNPETQDGVPKVEIIFFHGLQLGDYENAFWKTWLARFDENVVWPRDWLGMAFSTARILTISYDSSAKTKPGQLDMYSLGENLVSDVIMDGLNIGQTCPIIIVGHCLGGIVIKQFILYAERMMAENCQGEIRKFRKIDSFLRNIKGIFYYSPPHGGFNKEDKTTKGDWSSTPSSELLQLLLGNGKERARINEEFRKWRQKRNIRAYAIVENLPSEYLGTSGIVVDEVSGRWDIDSYYTIKANHFDVCKPEDMETSGIFRKLQDFIESILEEALQEGFENFQPMPKGAIGLDESMKQLRQKLSENHTVGIFGMGGKGKTTLGKAIFNKLNPEFEYSSFVPNVKSIPGTAEDVKKAVENQMHHHGRKVGGVCNWSELRGKQLLLVLDDVDKDHDLAVIADLVDNRALEFVCLVTSRDKELLTSNDVACYDMPFLREEDAKQLFISYAFSTPGEPPVDKIVKCADEIVKKCDGLPLTLEVIGKYLKSKKNDEGIWEQTLQALDDADPVANLDEKLWKKLRVSYDNLRQPEQQMFLDATTFFSNVPALSNDVSFYHYDRHWTLRDAKAAWSVIHGKEQLQWQTLVDLSLVYHQEDEDKPIRVHDQLKSMGRRIAWESKDGKRRWWKEEGGLEFLKSKDEPDDQDLQQVCSLRLRASSWSLDIPRSCLGRLKKVQFLDMEFSGLTIDGAEVNETFPTDNLVVLRCPDFHFFNLAACPRLAVLQLGNPVNNYRMTYLPKSFGCLSALKILSLDSFDGEILPDEFGQLAQLQRLKFDNCRRLRTLPSTFGLLSRLQYLRFIWCDSLDTLPDSFGDLCALSHLSFVWCDKLHIFPESIKRLAALKCLYFARCDILRTVPEFFGELSTLEFMEFYFCKKLETLPSPLSFARLAKLQHLRIYRCSKLDSLPFSAEHLPEALRHLEIGRLALHTIPDCVQSLPALQILELYENDDDKRNWVRIEVPLWLGECCLSEGVNVFHVQDGNFILHEVKDDE